MLTDSSQIHHFSARIAVIWSQRLISDEPYRKAYTDAPSLHAWLLCENEVPECVEIPS